MATRMQQRRGTAAQWISTNSGNGPILNAGEIGFETDTNRFKIGDGTNHWINLDYFIDANSTVNPSFGSSITFEGATANAFETTLAVTDPTADRTITFPDATGTVALTSDISEISQDAIDSALTAGTGITKTYNDEANTLTIAVDTTAIQARVADVSDTEIGYLNGVTSAIQTQIDAKAPTNSPTFTGTVGLPANTITNAMISDNAVDTAEIKDSAVTSAKIADGTIVNADINASAAIDKTKISGTAITAADTGTVTSEMIANATIVDGDISASAAIAQSKISGLTTDLSNKLALAGGTMTGAIAMGTSKITGLGTPTDSADAATKAYVDSVTEGLHIHASVIAATTANVALSTALENGDTLDGITLATGNRILVKNQTTQSENGIYLVQASGQPTRATDFDTATEVDSGDFVFVSSGTVNGGTGWVQVNRPATIGTDAIAFTQFSGAGTYVAGNGLTLTGNSFAIDTSITQARVANVSDTEIGYLDGVTSAIQTQLDAKVATSSLGSGVSTFLGTPSSANLISAITDETGTGSLVFANTPTLVTPNIGAATGTSLTTTGGGVLARAASTQDGVEIRGRDGGSGNWEIILTPTTLTADRTLTLPNESGTVLSSAQYSAKGGIIVGTGTGTYILQSVGTNGQVLTANSAQSDGVEWATISSDAKPDIFMLMGA